MKNNYILNEEMYNFITKNDEIISKMKPSQQKLYDWYKSNSTWFDNIETVEELETGEIEIITDTHYYLIGKRGGLTQQIKI